jgi:hypothetical protein
MASESKKRGERALYLRNAFQAMLKATDESTTAEDIRLEYREHLAKMVKQQKITRANRRMDLANNRASSGYVAITEYRQAGPFSRQGYAGSSA